MKRFMMRFIPLVMMLALASTGCASQQASTDGAKSGAKASQAKKLVYKGKIVGKSNKAKQISIKLKGGKQVMVSFGDDTVGAEHAVKGHGSIINYEMRDGKPYATLIKAKLAKMPPGVTEIQVEEVHMMLTAGMDFELIDSRPGQRYSESHVPTAISIPVCSMKELIDLLPNNKNKLLIFYCGGRT